MSAAEWPKPSGGAWLPGGQGDERLNELVALHGKAVGEEMWFKEHGMWFKDHGRSPRNHWDGDTGEPA